MDPANDIDPAADALFAGPGEMRARCRALDWAATSLGSVATWPEALRAAVRLCLDCGFPSSVHGGAGRVLVYNDAYIASLGSDKHPWALGRSVREVWPDAVGQMERNLSALLAGGPPVHHEDMPVLVERDGGCEQTFWTYALSLVRAGDGSVEGILTFGVETTARVRAESAARASEARQCFLVRLGDALRPLNDPVAIQDTASRLLGEHLGVTRAVLAELDGEVGEEWFTIRGQYVRDGAPFPERAPCSAYGARYVDRMRRGETLVVTDVLTDPDCDAAERAAWTDAGVRAAVAVGLVKGGRFVLSFEAHAAAARAWTADEIALVRETAERTWDAAERARAEAERDRHFERERRARERAEALQALASGLARAVTADEVADVVVTRSMAATETRFSALSLLEPDARTFTMVAAPGVPENLVTNWRQFPNAGDTPAAVAARTGRPCYSRTRAEYALRGPGHDDIAERLGIEAAAALPLLVQRRVIGILSLGFSAPRDFDAEEDAHLRALADLCGPALERARLQEAERARIAAESARAEAEAASRAKDDVLAIVSHELRAPLAPARALAQTLAHTTLPTSEVREMAIEIDRHIAYEARLIGDLLDYQRSSRGLLTLERRRCDLNAISRDALRICTPLFRAKGFSLTEELIAANSVVWADPMRIQQILFNLLSNSAKFSPVGTPVAVRTRNAGPEWVEVEISDRGPGIEADLLAQLFQPFTRVANPRPRSGLGLGLALSRRLAELHGGTIAAASEGRGRGATFTLRLPAARADEMDASATRVRDASRRDAADLELGAQVDDGIDTEIETRVDTHADRPLRILVIEDDARAAHAMRRLLSLDGHVVHVAESLAIAERIAGDEQLDVVLADLQLGGESGLAAPRRLADAARRVGRTAPPAVVLSGYDRDSDVARSREAGFVAHLAKPVDEQALLLAVRRAADQKSA